MYPAIYAEVRLSYSSVCSSGYLFLQLKFSFSEHKTFLNVVARFLQELDRMCSSYFFNFLCVLQAVIFCSSLTTSFKWLEFVGLSIGPVVSLTSIVFWYPHPNLLCSFDAVQGSEYALALSFACRNVHSFRLNLMQWPILTKQSREIFPFCSHYRNFFHVFVVFPRLMFPSMFDLVLVTIVVFSD